jgi:hypothetical protein
MATDGANGIVLEDKQALGLVIHSLRNKLQHDNYLDPQPKGLLDPTPEHLMHYALQVAAVCKTRRYCANFTEFIDFGHALT